MAKKEDAKFELAENKTKVVPLNFLGRNVLYYKDVGHTTGKKLVAYPAIISSFPQSQAGFQHKDYAVDLTIFGNPGGSFDIKQGVMYSEVPTSGRWSLNPHL